MNNLSKRSYADILNKRTDGSYAIEPCELLRFLNDGLRRASEELGLLKALQRELPGKSGMKGEFEELKEMLTSSIIMRTRLGDHEAGVVSLLDRVIQQGIVDEIGID